ncbi:flavin reductase family protein [Streptomyces sp. TRM 70351]|uniref:flavin reductase family protein n=1 Tax=Streptomyces sp. TRM 70351 TaxID=3116552 RepID=UPI002E7B2DD8|nr:flavin reductase family protein [Streptomyces sp. TRM 70351]MEE1929753.1 flavin reductase family protein [Streptomyces sp. TRM 70351]
MNSASTDVDTVTEPLSRLDSEPLREVEPAVLRSVMSRFATGVTVLSVGGEHIHGMTANAFSSVSLDPPQVLCCVARSAVMHHAITASGTFAVSILGAGQEGLSQHFADKRRTLGPAQFDDVDWIAGAMTGAPLLAGSLAWLECRLSSSHESGDHSVFIGSVLDARLGSAAQGLLFFNGRYGHVSSQTG